ncbi:MAG: hypothetical protein R2698_01315 [Microthrixaceae bacterium]
MADPRFTHHVERLAANADSVLKVLGETSGGGLHPEALPQVEHLKAGLHDMLAALRHHEHLAAKMDDVVDMIERANQPPKSGPGRY